MNSSPKTSAGRHRATVGKAALVASVAALALAGCASPNPSTALPKISSATRMDIADIAEAGGDTENARTILAAAAAADPGNGDLQLHYAKALLLSGHKLDALSAARKAADLNQGNAPLVVRAAQFELRAGDPELAARTFQQAADHGGGVAAFNGLGVARVQLGDLPGAEAAFRRAAAISPANYAARNNLALALVLQGRAKDAVPMLLSLADEPDIPSRVKHNLALAYAEQGDTARAAAVLADVVGGTAALQEATRFAALRQQEPTQLASRLAPAEVVDVGPNGTAVAGDLTTRGTIGQTAALLPAPTPILAQPMPPPRPAPAEPAEAKLAQVRPAPVSPVHATPITPPAPPPAPVAVAALPVPPPEPPKPLPLVLEPAKPEMPKPMAMASAAPPPRELGAIASAPATAKPAAPVQVAAAPKPAAPAAPPKPAVTVPTPAPQAMASAAAPDKDPLAPVLLTARVVDGPATPQVVTPLPTPAQPAPIASPIVAPPPAAAPHPVQLAAAVPARPLPGATAKPGASMVPIASMGVTERGPDGTIMIHIAAVPTRLSALALWRNLTDIAPDLLTGRSPLVIRTGFGRISWTLGTGGFKDSATAEQFCQQLRDRGPNCDVGL